MAKEKAPQQISLKVPYRDTISRLFIFRFLWIFPLGILMMFWAIWIGIVTFLQVIYMLVMGKRAPWLWHHMALIFVYSTRWNSYLQFVTDERPELFDFDLL